MTRSIIIIFIISGILFFANIGARDFWAPDEGDFALIAREMDDNFIVPHLNGAPYAEKPPLFYYMIYGAYKALPGIPAEIALRLPTAIVSLLFVILFFMFCRRYFTDGKALLSSLILVTTPLYYWQARYLQVDMAFSVFIAASLLAYYSFFADRKGMYLYAFWIFIGLAFMTKGPLAIILVFPVIFLHCLITGNWQVLKKKEAYLGSFLFLAIVIPWYLAIYLKEGLPFLYENIIRQNITRFLDAWSHRRPVYYYFTTLPLDTFPWFLFLPAGIFYAWKARKENSIIAFLFLWVGWMFLFFTLSSGKISKYMLPLVPALSLLVSHAWSEDKNRYVRTMTILLSIVFLVIAGLLFFYQPSFLPEFRDFGVERFLLGSVVAILAFVLFFLTAKNAQKKIPAVLVIGLVILYSIGNSTIYSKWNDYKSPKPLCDKIKPYLRDGAPWVYYGSIRGVYVYYVGKNAIHIDEGKTMVLKDLGNRHQEVYFLTRKRLFEDVSSALTGARIIIEEKVGDTPMVFGHFTRSRRDM